MLIKLTFELELKLQKQKGVGGRKWEVNRIN